MSRYHQRIPIVDPDNPQSWGKDDLTGLPAMHTDMVKYFEYMGNGLQWTGLMSHYKDVDQPNPQLVPPRLKADPVPIDNPRYLRFLHSPPIPTGLSINTITTNSAVLTWTAIPGITNYSVVWTAPWANAQAYTAGPPYTLTPLLSNATYFVAVASIDSIAQSAFSDSILFTTT